MKPKFARTIIWFALMGFSLMFYSIGWYEKVGLMEIVAGGYYSGFGFLTHWLMTERLAHWFISK